MPEAESPTDDAISCLGCESRFPMPEFELPLDPLDDPTELPLTSPPPSLAAFEMDSENVAGFSRPRWKTIHQFVQQHVPKEDLESAWCFIAEKWLRQLAVDMGGGCRVHHSTNFLCLSDLGREAVRSTLAYAESVVRGIRSTLQEAAWTGYYGKHVLLVFKDQDDYFAYISYYYGEGSHALSGGIFIRDGYGHIAFPYVSPPMTEHVLVHELVHNLLGHLRLPRWLNEGLAMVIESRLSPVPFLLDKDLVERHSRHWNEQSIQGFWAGTSFDEPGESNELSYSLAEILVSSILDKGSALVGFVTNADWRDAGQDAALSCLNMDLGEMAGGFLGPGHWRPQRKAIADISQLAARQEPEEVVKQKSRAPRPACLTHLQ
jgi:hypothetical protein